MHVVRVAGQVASGELDSVLAAGGDEGVEEAAVAEARRRRQGEEGVAGLRSHGGQVGEVDGQEAPGEEARVEARREVDPLDLAVRGHREGVVEPQHGGVVTDQGEGVAGAEPGEDLVLALQPPPGHAVAGCASPRGGEAVEVRAPAVPV